MNIWSKKSLVYTLLCMKPLNAFFGPTADPGVWVFAGLQVSREDIFHMTNIKFC